MHGFQVLHDERTDVRLRTLNPHWGHKTRPIATWPMVDSVKLTIWDWDLVSPDDELGSVYFPIDYLVQFTEEAELTHEVTTTDGQRHGRVRLRVQFTPDREVGNARINM